MAQLKLAIDASIHSRAIGFLKTEKGWRAYCSPALCPHCKWTL